MDRRNSISLIVVLLIGACADSANSVSDPQPEIEQQLVEIQSAVSAGGPIEATLSAYLGFFESAPTILPPGGKAISGHGDVYNFYLNGFSGRQVLDVDYEHLQSIVDGNLAVRFYTGTTTYIVHANRPPRPTQSSYRYFDVLRKQDDGRWLIVWHGWTPIE